MRPQNFHSFIYFQMKVLSIVLTLISITYSAPAGQYYIYTPSSTQYIKLQPQFIQTTSDLRLQDGKQILYYYPAAPIAPFTALDTSFYAPRPYQIIALKDEGGQQGGFDWLGFFQNWFQGGGQGGSESGAAPAEPSPSSETFQRFELEKEMMKMSPEKRKEFEKKYIVVSGSPFYTTLSESHAPLFTLQPLAISERSKETPILAETIIKPKLVEPVVVVQQKIEEPFVVNKLARSLDIQETLVEPAVAPLETIPAPVVSSEKKLEPEILEMMQEKLDMREEIKKEDIKADMNEVMKDEMKEDMKEEALGLTIPEGTVDIFFL